MLEVAVSITECSNGFLIEASRRVACAAICNLGHDTLGYGGPGNHAKGLLGTV